MGTRIAALGFPAPTAFASCAVVAQKAGPRGIARVVLTTRLEKHMVGHNPGHRTQ